jgi:hypothetical protein
MKIKTIWDTWDTLSVEKRLELMDMFRLNRKFAKMAWKDIDKSTQNHFILLFC